jgi:hypothetical protein
VRPRGSPWTGLAPLQALQDPVTVFVLVTPFIISSYMLGQAKPVQAHHSQRGAGPVCQQGAVFIEWLMDIASLGLAKGARFSP